MRWHLQRTGSARVVRLTRDDMRHYGKRNIGMHALRYATTSIAAVLAFTASLGCGLEVRDHDVSAMDPPEAPRLGVIGQDLAEGSSGDDVRALHDYLSTYGYFPNPKLADRYPSWGPVVPQGPADRGVFDAQTTLAVRAFQSNVGIDPTGVVDAPTRRALAMPRCSHPDGIADSDPTEKWSLLSHSWTPNHPISWHVNSAGCPNCYALSPQKIHDAIAAAVASWTARTSLPITESASTSAEIQISFGPIDGRGTTVAHTEEPGSGSGGDITIDTAEQWIDADPTPSGWMDLQSTVLHELGHALGIQHSSLPAAVMYPFANGSVKRTLIAEDAIGASVLYDTVQKIAGTANDIAVSAGGDIWIINNQPIFGGFGIQRWDGSTWVSAEGFANRIAVEAGGTPWVIGPTNVIYRRTSVYPNSGSWQMMPGCAHDIASGGNAIWVLGCNAAFGGWDIWQWNFATSSWVQAPGIATRIGVGPTGVPVVVLPNGVISRFSTNNAATGAWSDPLPNNYAGAPVDAITDIFVDAQGYTWLLPTGSGVLNLPFVLMQNLQVKYNDGSEAAPQRNRWYPFTNLGLMPGLIAVAGGYLPGTIAGNQGGWFVAGDHTIWRQVR
jgi:hypothetical protein